jgi:spermidine/putrescine transport system permease protein
MKHKEPPSGRRKRDSLSIISLIPLYAFTLLFIVGPLIYLIILSFLQRAEVWGVVNKFTLNNYINITTPIYLKTFYESFKLAILSTALIIIIGYPSVILWPS